MKYQLVCQWPASAIRDFDALIRIEGLLTQNLTEHHEVDGHDAGSGEINIFIITNDPLGAFEQAKTILGQSGDMDKLRAGYRRVTGNNFTILWPKTLNEFKII